MKCIILLAIVGACFAAQQGQEPGWDIGKTYTYQVQGHALSGLRVDQHGGLQLKYKVKLTRQGQNQYYLQPKDFQVVTNCVQECQQVPNRPIPQSLLQYLEAPIQFSMTPQGKVNSIRFDHSIPQWAMNFKKAQMAPFVTNNQYPQQLTRQQQQDQQQSKQQQKEKTVYGECQVQYLYEQYGQQEQHEQQSQYSPQGQEQQQQKQQQQQQQPWYQRIASYYSDDNDDDSSSSSSSQQDSNENGRRGQNQGQRQDQQGQQRRDQHQYQNGDNRMNRYNNNDDSSEENNSAQGFFAKLGRKMGMGSSSSESDESQEQNGQRQQRNQQQQNQIRRGHGQQSQESSEEQGQAEKKNCDSGDQKFQFLKMYRVKDCSHTPNFSNSSSSSTQRSINKRQIFTRYYACGQNKNKFNIYHIERREATKEAQEAVQQLTLVDISSASSSAQAQIQQPSTYSQLAYNFEVKQLKQTPIVEMDKQEYQKQLRQKHGVGQIDIFQDSDYQGQHTTLDVPVGKCLGLPSGWNDAISSVDPQLSCIILWEHRGCSGEAVRLERYSYGTSQLSRVNMDNKATAIQLC